MSLWLSHPLFLPSIIVGVTILLWGDFATAGVYDRTAIFCCGDGTRESSCAGGDAVMYRAGGDTPKRWLFCPAGDRA
ncbi:putative periplasmic protein [Salmonella enterica subsp. enterica]|nr:putative periplasmic protein [Salmonella enterica subsp. enterica]